MFPNFPSDSKVWVYQSSEIFSNEQQVLVLKHCKEFLATWDSHGLPMKTAVEIIYNRFIIICADENEAKAGGCSMDRLTRFIQKLEQEMSLTLLDRMKVAFETAAGTEIIGLNDLKTSLEQGKVSEETIVFNNLVSTCHELEVNWKLPLKASWHARFSG